MSTLNPNGFLRRPGNYRDHDCYRKSVVLYDLTYWYINHYLQPSDRTFGQMQQAARSGKQNIVEGLEDYMTSRDTGLHLVNVARGSLQELREDYEDQLRNLRLSQWTKEHSRFEGMLAFCREHSRSEDYARYYEQWDVETLCNTALTLIHQVDYGLMKLLGAMEADFLANGGVREQMFATRLTHRTGSKQKGKP